MDTINERELLGSIYCPPSADKPWRIEDLLAPAALRYFSYGRVALAEALKWAGLKKGESVLLPEFICREVAAAVSSAGGISAYYPVGKNLQPSSDLSRFPPARAVVAVNYFGFPQNLNIFK